MARYVISPEAREDLQDIRDFLVGEGGPRLAQYVLRKMTDAFRVLADHPAAGHLRQDLTSLAVKFWPVFSYLVVYDPAARPITIVRVLHGRREVDAILSRGAG